MTITSTSAPRRVRSALAVVGAAALLVGGVNVVAHAAGKAEPLLLGKANKAERTTTLKNTGRGPALKLKAKKGPALSVNTKDLVKNLNAETVGGRTATQLEPAVTVHALLASGATIPDGNNFRQFTLAPGTYLMNFNLAVETVNAHWFVGCVAADPSVFTTGDTSKIYVGFNLSDASLDRLTDSTRIVTVPTTTSVAYGCRASTSDPEPLVATLPPTLTVRQLSGAVAGSSTPIAVTLRQARAAMAR